ncbi:Fic family protein [Anaeromyxobacter sp. Red801]|uniref:Fic family protein n=1 Tax=Anaeromyxobacter sp. Red801 TaxID=3411632 RepID=UPI003B9FB41F
MASARAGRFIRQPGGFSAFIPAPLPPDPPVQMRSPLPELLAGASLALGRLDGVTSILPSPDLFVGMYVKKEAVLSSQIEGTQASLTDVLQFDIGEGGEERRLDVEEVVNYVAAMNFGLARVRELPLSLRLIREIHAKLMKGVRGQHRDPGEFRRTQNWIGSGASTIRDAAFVPPPPGELMHVLGDLEKFLHDQALPPLVHAGLAHAQFETIHPFLDGNGRVGRLLVTFLLCDRKVLSLPLLYLSWYFKQHRAEYYDRLQAVRLDGDWEAWLGFFLRGVQEVATEAVLRARKIIELRERARGLASHRGGRKSGNLLRAIDSLFKQPLVTASSLAKEIGVSFVTANGIALALADLGLLTEETGYKRNRRFRFAPFLALFEEAQEPDEDAPPRSSRTRPQSR